MNWVTYTLSGALVCLLLWFGQRRRWKMWIRVLCSTTVFLLLLAFIYFQTAPATLGSNRWYEASPYVELLFFVLMLTGMSARYVTKAIEVRRERIAELKKQGGKYTKPKLEFDIWEFSYPLFVSVVTFGALLTQLKDRDLSLGNIILSFQTGFFWQTIMTKQEQT